jgi:hypothetical protein
MQVCTFSPLFAFILIGPLHNCLQCGFLLRRGSCSKLCCRRCCSRPLGSLEGRAGAYQTSQAL